MKHDIFFALGGGLRQKTAEKALQKRAVPMWPKKSELSQKMRKRTPKKGRTRKRGPEKKEGPKWSFLFDFFAMPFL
jgi:hypothetical protein